MTMIGPDRNLLRSHFPLTGLFRPNQQLTPPPATRVVALS